MGSPKNRDGDNVKAVRVAVSDYMRVDQGSKVKGDYMREEIKCDRLKKKWKTSVRLVTLRDGDVTGTRYLL